MNDNPSGTSEQQPTTKLSKKDKLVKRVEDLKASLAKAEEALANFGVVATVEVGTVVAFRYGRGETAVVKSGTVIASKVGDNGVVTLAVESGTGFDKVVVRIQASAVLGTPVTASAEE